MINNINALTSRLAALEQEVGLLKQDKEILMGITLELEERLTKVENEAFDNLLEGSVDQLIVDESVGGTESDD